MTEQFAGSFTLNYEIEYAGPGELRVKDCYGQNFTTTTQDAPKLGAPPQSGRFFGCTRTPLGVSQLLEFSEDADTCWCRDNMSDQCPGVITRIGPSPSVRASRSWDPTVPSPPKPNRESWKEVYNSVPEAVLEGLYDSNCYVHPMVPLAPGVGRFEHTGAEPHSAPDTFEGGGIRQTLEYLNHYYMLSGWPCSRYAGNMPPLSPANRSENQTPRWMFTHTSSNDLLSDTGNPTPDFGSGEGPYQHIAQLQYVFASVGHGQVAFGQAGRDTFPQHLMGYRIPDKKDRGPLIDDPDWNEGFVSTQGGIAGGHSLLGNLYGHANGAICAAADPKGTELPRGTRAPDNTSRVYTYPPPGYTVSASFYGECIGGRKGLAGEEAMVDQIRKNQGYGAYNASATGGPGIKVRC